MKTIIDYTNAIKDYVEDALKPDIPPWSTGTDKQIADTIQYYYDGILTLEDIKKVWSIGDERKVNLYAISGVETHVAQTVTFVILNWGGKTLVDTDLPCLAVVGMKNILSDGTTAETGYMHGTNSSSWPNAYRRTWCNEAFRDSLPEDLKPIFKQFYNVTGISSSQTWQTQDYFTLASEIEVTGSATNSYTGEGSQLDYYKTSANIIKYAGDSGTSGVKWWLRSPRSEDSQRFLMIYTNGTVSWTLASKYDTAGFAPYGCI